MILARFACSDRVAKDGWQMMKYFSHKHKLHLLHGGVAVGARLFYNFPLDLVVNIFIFKLPDMVTQFSSVLLFYIGK